MVESESVRYRSRRAVAENSFSSKLKNKDTGCSKHAFEVKGKSSALLSQSVWVLLFVLYFVVLFCIVNYSFHYLPSPKFKEHANIVPQDFNEEIARSHLKKIIDLGQRPAGSIANEVHTLNVLLEIVKGIKEITLPTLKLEVDVQRPTGSFTIDFLGGFSSYYANITNTVVRLSPTKHVSSHTLLLNCHTDSVAGGPGASDDAIACAVLLEVLRALATDPEHQLYHPVVFLFNGAEENILQASHGFITKHKWAKDIKAFINLEAAGAGGKEIVFQTGPSNPWLAMTWAAQAPHPFGTVIGQELFQSGIIPSDTDFRIFRDYGNIPGIDLAYMRNGYVYHTLFDNIDMIQPGAIQRAGDNILAVVRHLLTSKSSLLPNPNMYRQGSIAFVDILGIFMLVIPVKLLSVLNIFCSLGGLIYVGRQVVFDVSSLKRGKRIIKATAVIVLTWVSCISTVAMLAIFITFYGHALSFYSKPFLVVFLYAFPGLAAMLGVHRCTASFVFKIKDVWELETIFFEAYLFIWSILLFQMTYLELQSSLVLLLCIAPVISIRCVFFKTIFMHKETKASKKMTIYLISLIPQTVLMLNHSVLSMELFIPLCGRLGSVVPPDLVIALLTAILLCLTCHFLLSLSHVAKSLSWFLTFLCVCSACAVGISLSSHGFPYATSKSNPTVKRLYAQHTLREFHRFGGEVYLSDSGLWVNAIDFPGLTVDMGIEYLKQTPTISCNGLFCHFPYGVPLHHLVKGSKYVPATKPVTDEMKKTPLLIKLKNQEIILVSENTTTRVYKKRLWFRVTGPPHMSVQIGPLASKGIMPRLTSWSIGGHIDSGKSVPTGYPPDKHNFAYTDWYYLYYGSGIKPEPWEPWFEFTISQDVALPPPDHGSRDSQPTVELAFAAQYYADDHHIPVTPQTEEIKAFLDELPDWVSCMAWVSVYKNYLY